MSDDPMKELGRIARERETERERFENDPANRELLAPITDAERARVVAHVAGKKKRETPRILMSAGGLALAAAILLTVVIPRPGSLPAYELEVPSLGYNTTRSEPAPGDVLQLARGMELEVILRPEAPVDHGLSARAYANERLLVWDAEIAPTGAVRFRGELGRDVELPAGKSRLKFVIDRAGAQRSMELDVDVRD